MKNKKVICLLLSLVLLLSVALPGTLAFSTDAVSSGDGATTAEPLETGEPVETTTPATEENPEGTVETVSEINAGETEAASCTECGQLDGHAETCSQSPIAPCEECGLTDGHAESCSRYEAPAGVAETTEPQASCTCPDVEGVDKSAEDYVHEKNCPLYVPVCTCEATEEEKSNPGFVHAEGCAFWVESEFDVNAAKKQLLACESVEEVESFLSGLSEAEMDLLRELVTEDEMGALAEKLGVSLETEIVTPPVDFTAVGPLMPAVSVQAASRMRRSPAKQTGDDNGLVLDKTATYDAETNKVTITLEAYTTGTVTTSTKSTPVDIVLVLDESGSMADSISQFTKVYSLNKNRNYYVKSGDSYVQVSWCNTHSGWYSGICLWLFHAGSKYEPMTSETDTTSGHVQFYESSTTSTSKREALIGAAQKFAEDVYGDATANNVDHRISVIGFSGSSTIRVGLEADIRENLSTVKAAIGGLNANGGTYIEQGLQNAEKVFDGAASTTVTERKRVVVVFTDGIPGSGTWNSSTISGSANPAISSSYRLKNTYGATVYAIGMLDDANPELAISNETNDSARTNKFLHYLSSNYPGATSMDNGGNGGGNNGYYLSASDTISLDAIFSKISEEIATPSIQLDENAVVRDVIAPAFNSPVNEGDIKVYTEDYNGTDFVGTRQPATGVAVTIDGNTVNVSGFNYNEYFVSDKEHDGTFGKKLIIEFTITPKDGFLGGNNVYTNGSASGVYENGDAESALENFPRPEVNIPIQDVKVTAENKHVYLLQGLTAEQLRSGVTAQVGGIGLNLSRENYGLADWQTEYVNISVTIQDQNGNAIADLSSLTEDGAYTVSVTVAPKFDGAGASGNPASTKSDQATGQIYVYKPELTFQDSTVYYGDSAPADFDGNLTATKWKHGDTEANPATMGPAPELSLTYTPEEGKIAEGKINSKQDIEVSAAVKLGGTDVTGYTAFVHTACTPECSWNTPTVKGSPAFLLHVQTCQLTVTKTGGAEGEPYVFGIYKDGIKYSEVTVVGNSSVTIAELPVGTYSIQEDTGWSWRYTPGYSSPAVLSAETPTGSITCTNTSTTDTWLNGFSNVIANIFRKTN